MKQEIKKYLESEAAKNEQLIHMREKLFKLSILLIISALFGILIAFIAI